MKLDVFISYKRSDLERVTPIADSLRAMGLNVWYDANLEAGSAFDIEITKALRNARCVLVCWSKESVESEWVRAEATEGRQRSKLVSCLLEPCEPYPPFNLVHHEDLTKWRGEPDHLGWRRVVTAIANRLERTDLSAPPAASGFKLRPATLAASAAAVLALGGIGAGWFWLAQPQSAPATPGNASKADRVAPSEPSTSPSPSGSPNPSPSGSSGPAPPPTAPGAAKEDASQGGAKTETAPVPTTKADAAPKAAGPATADSQVKDAPAQPEAEPKTAPPGRFAMVPDGQPRFGSPEQVEFSVAFADGVHAQPTEGEAFFGRLTRQFADGWVEGVTILAPQAGEDEAAQVLRDRRAYALAQGFIQRGVTPRLIVTAYADRPANSFAVTVTHRPRGE